MSSATTRNIFYAFLILCFLLGAFFKQFDIFYPKPFVLVAYCGAIGLLWDYTSRIRRQIWMLIPLLVSIEFLGDLIYNAGLRDMAFYLYLVSAATFLVYGLLFLRRGIQLLSTLRGIATKFIVLGLLSISLMSWEIATYFPTQIDKTHIAFRAMYMAVFAWLLFIDFSTDFSKRPELKTETQILRLSLFVIAAWYFVRFVFV